MSRVAVAPAVTVEVAGRAVTYQEVAVVFLPEVKCAFILSENLLLL